MLGVFASVLVVVCKRMQQLPTKLGPAVHPFNSVKKDKRKYFSENLNANKSDPRKTWRLINELQSRQSKSTKVSRVKTGTQVFTSPGDIAEAFNNHFTNIGQSLTQEIPSLEIDPLAYVNPVDGVFSFQRIDQCSKSHQIT